MLAKKVQQVEAADAGNTPANNIIQYQANYIADLERSRKVSFVHQAEDNYTSELLSLAKKMMRFYHVKDRNLGEELSALGEPVWKIFLQLVIAAEEGNEISGTDISNLLSIPETTAIRYIEILENKGYLVQSRHQTDQNSNQLFLTRQGRSISRDILFAMK